MIEIGKKFVWGYHNAQQAARNQRQKALSLAAQTEEQARALEQDYRAHTAYLFRTAAEKMRQSSQAALAALTQQQARRAANGVSGQSASAMEDKQQVRLAEQMQKIFENEYVIAESSICVSSSSAAYSMLPMDMASTNRIITALWIKRDES